MCGNRVEELESRVKELEASVEGLTDELVECKVRLQELENAVDDDLGFDPGESQDSAEPEAAPEDDGAEAADVADSHKTEPTDGEAEELDDSDIIVA